MSMMQTSAPVSIDCATARWATAAGSLPGWALTIWAGREGASAYQRSPLPIAMAHEGCAWRRMTLRALDRAGISYRIAYTCEHCSGQEAAMLADLAVAPFPKSLVKPPLKEIAGGGLPGIGSYQLALVRRGSNPLNDALASHVKEALQGLR